MLRASHKLALASILALTACGTLESSARKDPMKCERDPNCARHEREYDCSAQCADDPACVDRCRQINAETGTAAPR